MLTGLNHITLAVSHLDSSFSFYTKLLGFKPHVRWDSGAYLTLGNLWLCLSCDESAPAKDYTHIALDCMPEQFNAVASHLRSAGVKEWKQNTSEGDSIYFLDPDGHKLEIHCGNLQSRLASLKDNPYKGLIWY